MKNSRLNETLTRLSIRAASSVVARGRIASNALNATLLRRLSVAPGEDGAFLADPIFEIARTWESADHSLDDLSGNLLHPDLVAALDQAKEGRVPRERQPWSHQLAAWEAARSGLSCLVSSGTGSGKTECFMIPMLDDLLRDPSQGKLVGVRAIVIYPLNALIESQRERLAAWTEALNDRINFALYNRLTPETQRGENQRKLAAAEIGNRRQIRRTPPAILVTNVTMLEYLLLRAQDRTILEQSQELLRWIVLDEAHTYVGAQAAEMALLLRRVRAAFGVQPNDVRLMATSATISDDEDGGHGAKLERFVADLAGINEKCVRVIQGRSVDPELPTVGADTPLQLEALEKLDSGTLWNLLAPHPRIQNLKNEMSKQGVTLSNAATLLFGSNDLGRKAEAQAVLDAAARARNVETGDQLLPWRAHIFHRSQGGLWVCVDPSCEHRDPELMEEGSGWGFGAVWLMKRDKCDCGAPVFELFACNECGAPYLVAGFEVGARSRLVPLHATELDDFAVDAEPAPDSDLETDPEIADKDSVTYGRVILAPTQANANSCFLKIDDGTVFDNAPPEDSPYVQIFLEEDENERTCCLGAGNARLAPQRYSAPFFMGVSMPALVETLSQPREESGLPMGGRCALTFSDSRQGTARLAAKLQQEAERNLTRAFLYHAVQQNFGPEGEERAQLEKRLERFREINEPVFYEDMRDIAEKLIGRPQPIPWDELVERFAQHVELRDFATKVWYERTYGGRQMADDPRQLAKMFLYRELSRRPKVQNNAETMGLLRLAFPKLEKQASRCLPETLVEKGINEQSWTGLALASIDFVFRDRLATEIRPEWMIRYVSPRGRRRLNSICKSSLNPSERPSGSQPWPGPIPRSGRPSRLHRLVYSMLEGDWENVVDQDRAGRVFSALWSLITTSGAARDVGGGSFRIDFTAAAVMRVDHGWLCPITRRIFGYSPDCHSPYDPDQELSKIQFPRPPRANAGGLDPDDREEVKHWCETSHEVASLRRKGLWTNLHDRVAAYAPFFRAQEHSAQIERVVLADYERQFKAGRVNLLNCSTTMEMGIDIPNVQLAVNANVPPSVSNYRQRIGRAGRRGEPWVFGVTFCRDLPLDRSVFNNPAQLLEAPVRPPVVKLDSSSLVIRHVYAALLAAFFRDQTQGLDLKASVGGFFGATDDKDEPVGAGTLAEKFLDALRGQWSKKKMLTSHLKQLTYGSILEGQEIGYLISMAIEKFEDLMRAWREEYEQLLARREAAAEPEVKKAFELRARRMRGEFLISELARRGFTPSYGFPIDVVTFDYLSGHDRGEEVNVFTFGERRGGASRTLDVAIREYAPGVEVVMDGLVHRSEGVLPAWGATADASKLEDLQGFWECSACDAFWLARTDYNNCPQCNVQAPRRKQTLRPVGFLGRREPHTGYENLGHMPYEMPRLSAANASWQALPVPEAGRLRADPEGQVVTLGSGSRGKGYALCLICGRAEDEKEESSISPLPEQMQKHRPLAAAWGTQLVQGYCPGGYTEPQRVQRNVYLIHSAQTDIFELQLPSGARQAGGLALAAALREALAERFGIEVREIGLATGFSKEATGEKRISAFLYDRASGGAGLVSRLAEMECFSACLSRAHDRLACPEACKHGCPACVLRPDLNFLNERIDRVAGSDLARKLKDWLQIPKALQVFGIETQLLGQPLAKWINQQRRAGRLSSVTVYLHGAPGEWELAAWEVTDLFMRLKEDGITLRLVLENQDVASEAIELAQRLDLHRISAYASLAQTKKLPTIGDKPVLAIAESKQKMVAIVAPVLEEAIPGPNWGQGGKAALIYGSTPEIPPVQNIDCEQFVVQPKGNACLIRVGKRLDGSVTAFGRAFWELLEAEARTMIAALQTHKVLTVTYTDRYLLTPLNFRLLFEVIRMMPGIDDAHLSILTSRQFGVGRQGFAVFHSFAEDIARHSVLKVLFPTARIKIQDKSDVAHARSIKIGLENGQNLTVYLDQGFGAWRVRDVPKHDFNADPMRQARLLKSLKFSVNVEAGREAPIVLEDG